MRRTSSVVVAGLALALTLVGSGPAVARDKLEIGSPAPELNVEDWVKGSAVTIEKGKVYVIEFWATWCGPCRKSIPHLTKLQDRYGTDKVVVVGISDEHKDVVEKFVQKQGENMGYTVGIDRRNATNRAWMQAAGLKGIPAAFIVDRAGKIAFIGHPLDDSFVLTLESVVAGRYDPVLQAQADPILKSARRARTVRNWRMALRHYDEVIELNPRVFADVAIERFNMVLLDMKDPEQAYDYAEHELIGKKFAKDAGAQRMLAEVITLHPDIPDEQRDMDLALTAAENSLALDGPSNAEALRVAALVRYHRGEVKQAVEMQTRAYFLVSPNEKASYKRVLDSYRDAAGRAGT
jgi:thiol-disulfide isomerase/thioredoxin